MAESYLSEIDTQYMQYGQNYMAEKVSLLAWLEVLL